MSTNFLNYKMMKTVKSILVMLAFGLSLSSALAQYVPVDGFALEYSHGIPAEDPDSVYMKILVGDVGQIYTYADPWNATIKECSLESSDVSVVNVSDWGICDYHCEYKVFALKPGRAVITIRSLDTNCTMERTVVVIVLPIDHGVLVINPDTLRMETTDSYSLSAMVKDTVSETSIEFSDVTWSISDAEVASIEGSTVTALTPGTALITATALGGKLSATCALIVVRKPPAKPEKPRATLYSGQLVSGTLEIGIFTINSRVKFTSNPDVRIKYTTDGSDPKTFKAPILVSGIIRVDTIMTIRLAAYRDDEFSRTYSEELVCVYWPELQKPTADPPPQVEYMVNTFAGQTYESGTKITLKAQQGEQIRYTLNGKEPTEASQLYTGPITLNETLATEIIRDGAYVFKVIKAAAFKRGYYPSPCATFRYKVKCPIPVFDPATGKLSCSASSTIIRYTSNGSSVTQSSPIYNNENLNLDDSYAEEYKQYRAKAFPKYESSGIDPSSEISFSVYSPKKPLPTPRLAAKRVYSSTVDRVGYFESPDTLIVTNRQAVYLFSDLDVSGPDVMIHYTLDGTEPTQSSPVVAFYDACGSLLITGKDNEWITLKAKALWRNKPNNLPSKTAVFTFWIFDDLPQQLCPILPYLQEVDYGKEIVPSIDESMTGWIEDMELVGYVYTANGGDPEITFNYGFSGSIFTCCGNHYLPRGQGIKVYENPTTLKVAAIYRVPTGNLPRYDGLNYYTYLKTYYTKYTYYVRPEPLTLDIAEDVNRTMQSDIPVVGKKMMNFIMSNVGGVLRKLNGTYCAVIGKTYNLFDNYSDFSNIRSLIDRGDFNKLKQNYRVYPFEKSFNICGAGCTMGLLGYLAYNPGYQGFMNYDTELLEGKLKFLTEFRGGFGNIPLGDIVSAYAELFGSVDFGLTMKYKLKDKYPKLSTSLQWHVGMELGLDVGISWLGGVGVWGSASFHHKWDMTNNCHHMWLNGSGGTYERIVCFKAKQTLFDGNYDIWRSPSGWSAPTQDGGMIKVHKDGGDIYDLSDFEWMPRKIASAWKGNTHLFDGSNRRILQQSVFSETNPLIAEANGVRMMVFIADDPSKNDYNFTTLMYSLYNSSNDTWSVPKAVDNSSSRAEFYPSIAAGGDNNIYVTYQRSKTLFNNSTKIEDVFAAGEIAVAVFNTSTLSFGTPTVLTNNNIMDMSPKVVGSNSNTLPAVVVWIQNPDNDIFGTKNNSNRIMLSGRLSGLWADPVIQRDNLGAILELDASNFNSSFQIAYIIDNDNDLGTRNDRSIVVIGSNGNTNFTPVSNKLVSGIQFAKINGNKALVWFEEGKLRYMTEDGVNHDLTAEADMKTDKFKVFSNSSKTAVVYAATELEVGYLIARNYENGLLGEPYKLVRTDDLARYYDGFLDNTDTFNIVFNNSKAYVDAGELQEDNDLLSVKAAPMVNIKLTDIFYIQEEVKLGKPLEVDLSVKNVGGINVNGVKVLIDGVVSNTYPMDLKTGKDTTFVFNFNVPSNMTPIASYELSVEPVGMVDQNMNDNMVTMALGYANLFLSFEQDYTIEDTLKVTATLSNLSDFATNATLRVHYGTADGTVIKDIELGKLAGRDSITSELFFRIEYIVPEDKYFMPLYLEVLADAESEYVISELFLVYRAENEATLSGFAYEIVDGAMQLIPEVTATVWVADDENGTNAKVWRGNEDDSEFSNPQITEEDGYYNWQTTNGWWQVRLSKAGYYNAQSEWTKIPPQLWLNVEMTPDTITDHITLFKTSDNSPITVYPNPTNGKLRIESGELKIENEEYSIYNSIGQLVMQGILHDNVISVKHLPIGVYSLKIAGATVKFVKK